jgi:predicted ATPase/class 3 adenylate cyclase
MAEGGAAWYPRSFLLTDIVGSVSVWERDADRMSRAVARHDELVESTVKAAGGELVRSKGEGDSTFSVFTHPAEALTAAAEIQRAIAAERWPTEVPVSVRGGVHTGDAEPRDGDWYGPAVNRAARLRALADGGQTLVSGVTAGLAAEHVPASARLLYRGRRVLRGIERPEEVWELVAADDPRLGADPIRSPGLPVALDHFVGRSTDIARLVGLVAEEPLVTLTGPGGSGKTRLAIEVARSAQRRGDIVWLAQLATISDGGLVAGVVATSLGLGSEEAASLDQLLAEPELLSGLLVLDNCEHLIRTCGELVLRLLGAAPGLRILATSREPLGVAGERVWPVEPLAVPADVSLPYDELMSVESVELLVDRVGLLRPDLGLGQGDAHALARICRALDGLPLAIELAACRLRSLSLGQLADRLDDQLEVLTRQRAAVGEDARHRSLRLTLDSSYDLLSDEQRALARRLSRFVGGFRLDAVDAVCPEEADVLDGIDELVSKSLVTFDARTARYRMLEPIRQYLRKRLDEADESTAASEAHARWVAELCDRLGSRLLDDQKSHSIRLREETGNVEAALVWALGCGDDEIALRIVGSLGSFWFINDQLTGRRWCAEVIAATPGGAARRRAKALLAAGIVAQNDRDHARSIAWLRESIDLYRGLASKAGEATSLFWLARTIAIRGQQDQCPDDIRDAMRTFEEGLHSAERLGNVLLAAWCRLWLCADPLESGDLDRTEQLCLRVLADCDESGVRHPLGQTWRTLAEVAYRRGDHQAAMQSLRQAVDVYREIDDPWQLAGALLQLATSATADDAAEALQALAASAMLHAQIGPRPDRAVRLAGAAIVHLTRGDTAMAAAALGAWDTHKQRGELGLHLDALERARRALDPASVATAAERARRVPIDELIDELILRPADADADPRISECADPADGVP